MIYVSHGVVAKRVSDRLSHMLLLQERDFVLHLQRTPRTYVSLEDALAGRGDALTVDDATIAGFRQVMLARRYGHEVTWFVNGAYISERIPYFPFLISCMVDITVEQGCFYCGRWWELGTPMLRQAFRLYLKQMYLQLVEQKQVEVFLEEISKKLKVKAIMPDPNLATATLEEAHQAMLAGVNLQNHGWTHLNPVALAPDVCAAELMLNARWLKAIRPSQLDVYAPPYGRSVQLPPSTCSVMLLADRSMKAYSVGPNIINRAELRLGRMLPLAPRDLTGPASTLLRM